MNVFKKLSSIVVLSGISIFAFADISVPIKSLHDHKAIGTVIFKDTKYGLLIHPNLNSLTPGLHGFHIHEVADCGNEGIAAKGHLDPKKTAHHLGPYNEGHLGDLPVLYVDDAGNAITPILAPRLKLALVNDHALMVHSGPDNYSDNPPMGGGGSKVACGIIKES